MSDLEHAVLSCLSGVRVAQVDAAGALALHPDDRAVLPGRFAWGCRAPSVGRCAVLALWLHTGEHPLRQLGLPG